MRSRYKTRFYKFLFLLQVGDVRLGCLKCLEPLYSTDELSPKLELFTNRFKVRSYFDL